MGRNNVKKDDSFAGTFIHSRQAVKCKDKDGKKIWGSASNDLIKWFEKNKGEHDLVITNEPFNYEGKFKS